MSTRPYRVAILTVSDRGAAGARADLSGPAAAELLVADPCYAVVATALVSDDIAAIAAQLVAWADDGVADLILTTGGTGLAPRDRTPEATRQVLDWEVPGIPEAMRAASLRITPFAMLTRMVAGVRRRALIINLPGSPKAVRENLAVVLPVLPHALDKLLGDPSDCAP